jgi:hypothetical protein
MTTWLRVAIGATVRCGHCGAVLLAGTPVARVVLPRVRRVLARCETCVGPAPPDLPALVVRALDAGAARCDHKFVDSTHCLKCGWTPPPPAFASIARLATDWQTRAAGREPGEDD